MAFRLTEMGDCDRCVRLLSNGGSPFLDDLQETADMPSR
jgi:hypothetical protein